MSQDSEFEQRMAQLDTILVPSPEAIESALDSMAFVANLNEALRTNGADLPQEPDTNKIGVVLDGVFAELAAACIFLSEDSFVRVPKMLRGIADAFEKADVDFKDPTGEVGPSVPKVVVQGYRALAARIEASRIQKAGLLAELKKHEKTSEGT